MTKNICYIHVNPQLPQNFTGNITFPKLVKVDPAGTPTDHTGPVTLISRKHAGAQYPFEAVAAAGIATLNIAQNPGFFSSIYDAMYWEAKDASNYASLYWEIDGEFYDRLEVSFSPEECDLESGAVTYQAIPPACDPCAEERC